MWNKCTFSAANEICKNYKSAQLLYMSRYQVLAHFDLGYQKCYFGVTETVLKNISTFARGSKIKK